MRLEGITFPSTNHGHDDGGLLERAAFFVGWADIVGIMKRQHRDRRLPRRRLAERVRRDRQRDFEWPSFMPLALAIHSTWARTPCRSPASPRKDVIDQQIGAVAAGSIPSGPLQAAPARLPPTPWIMGGDYVPTGGSTSTRQRRQAVCRRASSTDASHAHPHSIDRLAQPPPALLFCDYLWRQPAAAANYALVKRELPHADDVDAYYAAGDLVYDHPGGRRPLGGRSCRLPTQVTASVQNVAVAPADEPEIGSRRWTWKPVTPSAGSPGAASEVEERRCSGRC